jgi:hypothetical protein
MPGKLALAATAITGISAAVGVKTQMDQARAAKRSQRALIAQQKEEQRRNAVEQRRELDEVNRKKASTQRSILGTMFQKTLSGSRIGVTRKFGGGN